VLGTRFGVAAIAAFVLLKVLGRPLLPVPGERLRAFLFGAIGYTIESTFFFAGLERGSAAAVVLLFYSYPAIVALIEWQWSRRRVLTLLLSVGGTAIVVAAGGGGVEISNAGVVFALCSATSFSIYLLLSNRLITRSDSLTISAWVSAGAACSMLLRGVVTTSMQAPGDHAIQLFANGVASGAAFAFMFATLRRLGPRRTSIIMTTEALFAILLAAVFLDETIGALQLAGGAAILSATILTSLEVNVPID